MKEIMNKSSDVSVERLVFFYSGISATLWVNTLYFLTS